jgi:hypothetical protein
MSGFRIFASLVFAALAASVLPAAAQTPGTTAAPEVRCTNLTLSVKSEHLSLTPAQILKQCRSSSNSKLILISPTEGMTFSLEPATSEVRTFIVENDKGDRANAIVSVERP